MSQQWKQQSERGSSFLMNMIAGISLKLGRNVGRLLLYPITLYFVFFSRKARLASHLYLQKIFPEPISWGKVFRHYHTFSATILDRIFFLSNKIEQFDIDIVNHEILENIIKTGKGCILMGSHLGSFEVLRYLAEKNRDVDIKILMYVDNAEKMNKILHALNPNMSDLIIPLGHPDSLLAVKETVDAGGIVAILADRVFADEKFVECEFLGRSCRFPSGPVIMASILKAPVVLFYGLYEKNCTYRVYFELLADEFKLERNNRDVGVAQWMQVYASRLEYYCKRYPYNWFNFYDFWDETERK